MCRWWVGYAPDLNASYHQVLWGEIESGRSPDRSRFTHQEIITKHFLNLSVHLYIPLLYLCKFVLWSSHRQSTSPSGLRRTGISSNLQSVTTQSMMGRILS